MSWHYLQEQEVACWDPTCSDGIPDALSRLIPTADPCCSQDNATDACHNSQFGMTCEPSTANPGAEKSTLSAADSPAKTSAQRVKAQDLPASVAACGSKWKESLAKCGLVLSSRKTVRTCVPVGLAPSSRDLPAWGMTCAGACWELGTSVRHTSEIGCGLWRGELVPTLRANKWGLPDSHGNTKAWEQFLLPTPTAQTYGYNKGGAAGRKGKARPSLETLYGGVILPLREWLMGWPIGWTALEPLETAKFQRWLRSHGKA